MLGFSSIGEFAIGELPGSAAGIPDITDIEIDFEHVRNATLRYTYITNVVVDFDYTHDLIIDI